jgi:phosphinothricin acetyltransferase
VPQIRDAAVPDLPDITAIYREAVLHGTASYELEPPAEAEMQSRMAVIKASGYPYIVMVEGTRIVGYAYANAFRARPAYRFMAEDSIYLASDSRGKGYGKLLLEALVDACIKAGLRQVIAVIGDGEHNHASVKLHAACGFIHSGRITGSGFKHGRWLDTVLMQRAINGGIATLPDA